MADPRRTAPWLTAAVLVTTAVPSIAGDLDPDVLRALERSPAVAHGQWWRLLTALLAQDGGVPGTVLNLVALAVLGVVAERAVGRRWWLAAYVGAGLVGEVAGLAWQPVGAGNSVAVCGLAGLLAVGLAGAAPTTPRWASLPALLWVGGLLGGVSTPLLVACVVLAALSVRVLRAHAGALTLVVTGVGGVVLALARDLHGPPLLAGLLVGALVAQSRST